MLCACRRLPAVTAALVATLALAADRDAHADDGDTGDFWAWVAQPHGAEIDAIIHAATALRVEAQRAAQSLAAGRVFGYDAAFTRHARARRARLLAKAIDMLRHGLELDPDNARIQLQLAAVAEDAERYQLAAGALTAYLDHTPADRVAPEAWLRLGRIRARFGELEDATALYVQALAADPAPMMAAQIQVCLAQAYMQLNRVAEAIDVLRDATDADATMHQGVAARSLLLFALAVAYDRDEQLSRAHAVLTSLLADDQDLRAVIGDGDEVVPLYAPPWDQHYFHALRYEAVGELHAARTEWQAYIRATAAHPRAPFRARALAHVATLDHLHDDGPRTTRAEAAGDPQP